jgi:cobalt/nickel transport system permease protein
MSWPEPRRSRLLLVAWLAAAFAVSAATDLRALAAAWAAALLIMRRGAGPHLKKALLAVVPLSAAAALASWSWARLAGHPAPEAEALAAVVVRPALIAFLGLAVLARLDPFRALEAWPTATRLLAIALAQIHALRLLASDSALGLRSRLPGRPRAGQVLRGAGAITGTLFTLAVRNARDVSDALRSRGP